MTKSSAYDPHRLNILQFAQDHVSLEGRWPLTAMPRLAGYDLSADRQAHQPLVVWKASGEQQAGSAGAFKTYLHLEAQVPMQLRCERCLEAVPHTVSAERSIRFVKDEATAAQLDAHDDEEDVLALPPSLDLQALIEDELILALPLAPRHDNCRLAHPAADARLGAYAPSATTDEGTKTAPTNPFAVLAGLKNKDKGKSGG